MRGMEKRWILVDYAHIVLESKPKQNIIQPKFLIFLLLFSFRNEWDYLIWIKIESFCVTCDRNSVSISKEWIFFVMCIELQMCGSNAIVHTRRRRHFNSIWMFRKRIHSKQIKVKLNRNGQESLNVMKINDLLQQLLSNDRLAASLQL